ncbi:MAG: hypothetical protein QOG71_3897 [Pyrinomonadaceae bacterium]|nr:hypothetical protein [Pyrinomonadaceae bacterium]
MRRTKSPSKKRHKVQPSSQASPKHPEQINLQLRESFARWAFSTVLILRKTLGIGVVFVAALSLKNFEFGKPINTQERAILAFIQAVACLLLAVMTPKSDLKILAGRQGVSPSDLVTAKKACRRIKQLVVATFICWSLYYLITGLSLIQNPVPNVSSLFDRAILATFNTLPSLMLFWLYIELAKFTVDKPDLGRFKGKLDADEAADLSSSDATEFTRLISSGIFILITAPMWAALGWEDGRIISAFEVITSCLNGVCIALVVGRLDSKIIDLGSIPIGLLYFYAVIQPTAATFHDKTIAHLIATTVALPLKVLFWLVFVWAFTTGAISEYVHTIRVLLIRDYTRRYSRL